MPFSTNPGEQELPSGHSVFALAALLLMAGFPAAAACNRIMRYRLEDTG